MIKRFYVTYEIPGSKPDCYQQKWSHYLLPLRLALANQTKIMLPARNFRQIFWREGRDYKPGSIINLTNNRISAVHQSAVSVRLIFSVLSTPTPAQSVLEEAVCLIKGMQKVSSVALTFVIL